MLSVNKERQQNTWEVEAGVSGIQGHPQQYTELKVRLGYET